MSKLFFEILPSERIVLFQLGHLCQNCSLFILKGLYTYNKGNYVKTVLLFSFRNDCTLSVWGNSVKIVLSSF